jgi:hypothetical protein
MFAGGSGPLTKYSSLFGNASNSLSGSPKFLLSSRCGEWPIQSETLKVPNSEKYPLSKIRMKWHGLSPKHWIEWACPRGKSPVACTGARQLS